MTGIPRVYRSVLRARMQGESMATTLRADDDRVLLEKLTISRPSAARNQEIHEHRDNKKMETTWPAMPNIQVKILG